MRRYLIAGVGLIFAILGYVMYKAVQAPPGNAAEFQAMPGHRAPGKPKLIACIGDSLTEGNFGARYLDHVKAPDQAAIMNAGVGGDTAWQVNKRLDTIIALKPDAAVLLVGNNDVMGAFDESTGAFYTMQGVPQLPTKEFYRESLTKLLTRMQQSGIKNRAVLTISPIGENESSAINQQVAAFNEVVREVAQTTGTVVLPNNERMWDEIRRSQAAGTLTAPQYDYIERGPTEERWPTLPYIFWRAIFHRHLGGVTWDSHGEECGLYTQTDTVHLSERGAKVTGKVVSEWVGSLDLS